MIHLKQLLYQHIYFRFIADQQQSMKQKYRGKGRHINIQTGYKTEPGRLGILMQGDIVCAGVGCFCVYFAPYHTDKAYLIGKL